MSDIVRWVTIVCWAAAPAVAAQDMTAAEVIEKLKANPIPTAYTADMALSMTAADMPITMNGAVAYDDGATRMETRMNTAGQESSMTTVIDRDGMQWIETRIPSMNMTQAMKMDTKVIAEIMGDLPGMDMLGQGSTQFRFSPEMYDALPRMMDLTYEGTETVDGKETHVISGSYKDEYINEIDANGNLRTMGAIPDRTTYYITTDRSFPIRITMSSESGMNGEVRFSNIDMDPEFDEDSFTYAPPQGVTPIDVTEMMRQQLSVMRGGSGEHP